MFFEAGMATGAERKKSRNIYKSLPRMHPYGERSQKTRGLLKEIAVTQM